MPVWPPRPGPGQDRRGPVRGHAAEQRPDLLSRYPRAGPELPLWRGRRDARRLRVVADGGGRDGPGHPDRPDGLDNPPGPGREPLEEFVRDRHGPLGPGAWLAAARA